MDVGDGNPQVLLQVAADDRLAADRLDAARFARRHLTQKSLIDGIFSVGDAGNFNEWMVAAATHVAAVLAEGAFGFAPPKRNFSFDDDLGGSRYHQIDAPTARH